MSVNDDDFSALVGLSTKGAAKVLQELHTSVENPTEGILVLIVAVSAMARSMDMPLQTLQEGVQAAYLSIEEVTPHATH